MVIGYLLGRATVGDLGSLMKIILRVASYVLLSILLLVFSNFTAAEMALFIQALAEKGYRGRSTKDNSRFWERRVVILCTRAPFYERWTILGRCSATRQSRIKS